MTIATSTAHRTGQLVDPRFAALNADVAAVTVTALDVAEDDLRAQLRATLQEIAALPADKYDDDERDAYTQDAVAQHLDRLEALQASPLAFLGVEGAADCMRRAERRTTAARARAARARWETMQAEDTAAQARAARVARRARDARTARMRRASRLGYVPQVRGNELGLDFAAMAAADDAYVSDVRADLAHAGLL